MPTNNDLVLIRSQLLTDIADAIRTKTGSEQLIYPADMDTEILSIPSETHSPITVNITQSANQTIRVSSTSASNWANRTTSGVYNVPAGIVLTATVTPNTGYDAGELNQTRVTAAWGSTVSFSATPAVQRIGVLNVTMSSTANRPNVGDTITVTYAFTAVGGGTDAQTFTNEYSGDSFTVPALNENRSTTHMETFVVEESDVISGYVDCDVLTNEEEFTKTGSFTIATASANPALTVDIGAIDFDDPLEQGSIITYNVIVTNTGNLTLTDIVITSNVSGDEWTKDSLAPGQSVTYYNSEAEVTAEDVENEYIRLDAQATADNPIPNGANITASNYEDISISTPVKWAVIYLLPSTDGFTVSTNMTNTAIQNFETIARDVGFGANPENADLCTIYDGVNFVRTIAPQTELVLNDELNTYNEDDYLVDTSNNTLPLHIALVLNATNLDAIPFDDSPLGFTFITNYAINLTGLRAAIVENEIDVTNGIFIYLFSDFLD